MENFDPFRGPEHHRGPSKKWDPYPNRKGSCPPFFQGHGDTRSLSFWGPEGHDPNAHPEKDPPSKNQFFRARKPSRPSGNPLFRGRVTVSGVMPASGSPGARTPSERRRLEIDRVAGGFFLSWVPILAKKTKSGCSLIWGSQNRKISEQLVTYLVLSSFGQLILVAPRPF